MSSRMTWLKLAPLGLLLLLPMAFTDTSSVGPPWISIEIPANPMDAAARGAAMLVHAYHHGNPAGYSVSGTAEGLVNGERQTIPLEFISTSRAGIYALKQQWPAEGYWVLTLSVGAGDDADASLVVELGEDGGVRQSDYYTRPVNILTTRSVQIIAGAVDAEKIESALRAMAMASEVG